MAARSARLAVAAQIEAEQGVTRVIQRRADVGVASAVLAQAVHQADDCFGRGLRLPALKVELDAIGGLLREFDVLHRTSPGKGLGTRN